MKERRKEDEGRQTGRKIKERRKEVEGRKEGK